MGIIIDEAKCIGCGLCEISCAYDAVDVHIKARVDNSRCTDCTVCLDYCPTECITMEAPASLQPAPLPAEASFDVAVIGSGVGGLSAGALLAQRGYKTLVIERFRSVGGRYSSLRHGNMVMPTGGSLIQVGTPLEEVFQELGLPFDVVVPGLFKYWVRGKGWVDPGAGSGQFRRALVQISDEPEAVDAVLNSMRTILQEGPYPVGSMLDWLDSLTDNDDIKSVFRVIAATAFGPEDVSASSFFAMLSLTAGKGVGVPREGGLHLMRLLAKAVARTGGEVWTGSTVRSIIVEDGKAVGMLVERGGQTSRVSAKVVVSNAGPKQTARLVGPGNLDPGYLARLEDRVKPMCGVALHLISDRGLLGDTKGFVYTVGTRRICTLFDASLMAPWSPPGVHITEVYTLTGPDPDEPVVPEVWVEESTQDLDDMLPGWREHSQMKVICFDKEYPGNHTWTGLGASIETPITNLFLVGDGCESVKGWAGGTAAAESAQRVAALVQERFPLA